MLLNLKNEKIICCLFNDIALSWVYFLDPNKNLYFENNDYVVFRGTYNYFLFYRRNYNDLYNLLTLITKENYVHWIITSFKDVDYVLEFLDKKEIQNFDYSILNHMGEVVYEDNPLQINNLKNYKYYFSCSDLLVNNTNRKKIISDIQKSEKFILDYQYSLIYFYVKLGFNFLQRGEHLIQPLNRPGVFLYGKSNDRNWRKEYIEVLSDTNKTHNKSLDVSEEFWFNLNNRNQHQLSLFDYSVYQYNFIFETQSPFDANLSEFITEKTLKALLCQNPCYVLLQPKIYEKLKNLGYFFLNQRFGDYNDDNFKNFCYFIKNADDITLKVHYDHNYAFSKQNKIKLENYIYSLKKYELDMLLG